MKKHIFKEKIILVTSLVIIFIVFVAYEYIKNKDGSLGVVICQNVKEDSNRDEKIPIKEDVEIPMRDEEINYVRTTQDIFLRGYKSIDYSVFRGKIEDGILKSKPFIKQSNHIRYDNSGNIIYVENNNIHIYDSLKDKIIEVKGCKEFKQAFEWQGGDLVGKIEYSADSNVICWDDYKEGRVQNLYIYDLIEDKVNIIDCTTSEVTIGWGTLIAKDKFLYRASDTKGQQSANNIGIIDLNTKVIEKPIKIGEFFGVTPLTDGKVIVEIIEEDGTTLTLVDLNLKSIKPLATLKSCDYRFTKLSPDRKNIVYAIKTDNSEELNIYVAKIEDDSMNNKTLITTTNEESSLFWGKDNKLVMEEYDLKNNGQLKINHRLKVFSIDN